MTAPIVASSQSWTSYITLEDAKNWLQFPANASTSTDGNLQLVIDMACEWVQNEINRPVAGTTYTERHDGWAGEYIMLNQYPIIEFVSVTEFMSFGGDLTLPESTPDAPIESDCFTANYLTGQIMRSFAGGLWPRPFFPGSRNIEITYVAGYNPIPPTLRMATLELIKHWWVNTQQASRQVVKSNEYDPTDNQSGLWQGVPYRITALLASYRRTVLG